MMKHYIIKTRKQLSSIEVKQCHHLNGICQKVDATHRQPYLSNMLNFNKEMPAFILAYQDEQLVGLLCIYSDDKNEPAEVSIIVTPDERRKGIATTLLEYFYAIQAEYQLLGPLFVTEQIFLDKNPRFLANMQLVEEVEYETWLFREPHYFDITDLPNVNVAQASSQQIEVIAQFQSHAFQTSLETSRQYAQEAISDEHSLLYVMEKDGEVIASCTVDLSTKYNYLYSLAVSEPFRGKGLGSTLVKYIINDLSVKNQKSFQIAVEKTNTKAWRLYKNLGFIEQTKIVYLRKE